MLALGLLNFLVAWSVIYAVTQFQLPDGGQRELLKAFGFDLNPESGGESGYIMFMQRQSLIVTILLAFSGSLLVGADFRQGALPFYLSRRIDRRHYILGKLLAIGAIVSLLTVIPAARARRGGSSQNVGSGNRSRNSLRDASSAPAEPTQTRRDVTRSTRAHQEPAATSPRRSCRCCERPPLH